MTELPRWKVQAALRLLGIHDPDSLVRTATIGEASVTVSFGPGVHARTIPITDKVEDPRMHVLGIDPANGDAVLTVCPDDDVKFYAGAKMYLHSGVRHANGTLCPVFKKVEE